jgi:hypothetical protein
LDLILENSGKWPLADKSSPLLGWKKREMIARGVAIMMEKR